MQQACVAQQPTNKFGTDFCTSAASEPAPESLPPADVVSQLVQCYPEAVKLERQDGWLPLHIAAEFGNLEVVSPLLRTVRMA
mgnify:CR=1 FL=1